MRLIDADAMIDRLDTDEYGMRLPKAVAGLTKVLIDDAPTIVTKLIKYYDEEQTMRLIDADAMIDRLDTDEYGMRLPKAVAGLTKVLIDDAPTIVTKLIKYYDEE